MQVSREPSLDDERKMMHVDENFPIELIEQRQQLQQQQQHQQQGEEGEEEEEEEEEDEEEVEEADEDDEDSGNNDENEIKSKPQISTQQEKKIEEQTPPQTQHQQQQILRFAPGADLPISIPSSTRFSNNITMPQGDSLVAQMRNIIEGASSSNVGGSSESTVDIPKQQPKSSSDSLNNQNDEPNASKTSLDSNRHGKGDQQVVNKRDGRRQHCAHHHHYHHHHHSNHHHHHHARRSIGEVTIQGDDAPTTIVSAGDDDQAVSTQATPGSSHPHHHSHHHYRHHHHHGHHRHIVGASGSGGHRHRGHHHHHHHHNQQQSGTSSVATRNSKQRASLAQIEPIKTKATTLGGSGDIDNINEKENKQQHQATNESKSSNSSVSSTPADTLAAKYGQQQQQQINPNQSTSEPVGESSEKIDSKTSSNEECSHHRHHKSSMHHKSIDNNDTRQQQPHQHGHHHHHHYRCHHRHKKRLVLDTNSEQHSSKVCSRLMQDADKTSILMASSGDIENNLQEKKLEQEKSNTDASKLEQACGPLQELTSKTNISLSYCPYHESKSKQQYLTHSHPNHHHHHHHHHHHQHNHSVHCQQQTKDCSSVTDQEQQQNATRLHHHHHHRHHRHHQHHHHGHHSKQRHRKKSLSKTNLDETLNKDQAENSCNKDKSIHHQVNDTATEQSPILVANGKGRDCETAPAQSSNNDDKSVAFPSIAVNPENDSGSENKMHLDQDEEASNDKENFDIVKMEMSPNSEGRQSRLAEDCEQLVDSTASDSNLITSIEVIPLPSSAEHFKSGSEQTVIHIDDATNKWHQSDNSHRHRSQYHQDHQAQQNRHDINAPRAIDFSIATHDTMGGQVTNRDSGSNKQDEVPKENYSTEEEGANRHNKLVRHTSSSNDGSKKSHTGELGAGDGATGGGSNERNDNNHENNNTGPGQHIQRDYPSNQSSTFHQQSHPKQVVDSNVLPDRRCRLCWCCCCPCSALSNRNIVNRPDAVKPAVEPSNASMNQCFSPPNVSLDEIRAWGESFDRLMKCSDGRKVFQDFLRCEYSEENILFWTACEELKAEKDSKNIASKARDIYEDYISILSSKEVSLDSRVRDVINNNIKKPTSNIFDEAQLQIYTLMHRDSYPRFINSHMYKKLAQIQPTSRKSSS